MNDQQPLWTPSQASIDAANMTAFIAQVNRTRGLSIAGYDSLYQWSIDSKEDFWSEVWDFCGIIGDKGERILVDGDDIEKAQWFPDASLNFAENLLRRKTDDIAIHFRAEDQADYGLTYRQLYEQVASVAAWLKSNGLQPGDRVAAYLPNMPEAVVAMLAATSLGAVWTSTSPDFGVDSVVDRFGQTEPRFLFTVDGYFYNGKRHQISDKIDDICSQVGSIEQVVQVDLAGFGNNRRQAGRRHRLRAAQLQRPALRALFLRHHRQAQVYYAQGRRHADTASEGTHAALRPAPGRARVLFHHPRLDDVELAG
jgi:acetoacetyl-CoA synthetase